jgi:hypothetical protein
LDRSFQRSPQSRASRKTDFNHVFVAEGLPLQKRRCYGLYFAPSHTDITFCNTPAVPQVCLHDLCRTIAKVRRHIDGASIVALHAVTRVSAPEFGFGKLPGKTHNDVTFPAKTLTVIPFDFWLEPFWKTAMQQVPQAVGTRNNCDVFKRQLIPHGYDSVPGFMVGCCILGCLPHARFLSLPAALRCNLARDLERWPHGPRSGVPLRLTRAQTSAPVNVLHLTSSTATALTAAQTSTARKVSSVWKRSRFT